MYGDNKADYVSAGVAKINETEWVRLVSGGSNANPLNGRKWVTIQGRGPQAFAIAYTNKDRAKGTFTAPTYNAASTKVLPAMTVYQAALSENVMMWGRMVKKIATTGGIKVSVTEFS